MPAKLPPHVERKVDASGKAYYVDHFAQTTSWEPPIPEGWEEQTDASGRKFYIDHNNRSTSWEDPRLLYDFAAPAAPPLGITTPAFTAPAPEPALPAATDRRGSTGLPGPADVAHYPGGAMAGAAYPPHPGAATAPAAAAPATAYNPSAYPAGLGAATAPSAAGLPATGYPAPGGYPATGYPPSATGAGAGTGMGAGVAAGIAMRPMPGVAPTTTTSALLSPDKLPSLQVDDAEELECFKCKNKYSLFRHRHHCRCCGHTFCSDCLPTVSALPWVAGEPQKVCGECSTHLRGGDTSCLMRCMVILQNSFPDISAGRSHPVVADRELTALVGVGDALIRAANSFVRDSTSRRHSANSTIDDPFQMPDHARLAGSAAGLYAGAYKTGSRSDPAAVLATISRHGGMESVCAASFAALSSGDPVRQTVAARAIANAAAAAQSLGTLTACASVVCRSHVLEPLIACLRSTGGSAAPEAARAVYHLVMEEGPSEVKELLRPAGIAALCEAVTSGDPSLQLWSVLALKHCMIGCHENRNAVRESGGLVALTSLLAAGDTSTGATPSPEFEAAADCFSASMLAESVDGITSADANRSALVGIGAVGALCRHLTNSGGAAGARLSKACLHALHSISSAREGCDALLRAEAFPVVVRCGNTLAAARKFEEMGEALSLLRNAVQYQACRLGVVTSGVLTLVREGIASGNERLVRTAAQLLRSLAAEEAAQETLVSSGILEVLCTMLMASTGTTLVQVAGAVSAFALTGSSATRGEIAAKGGAEALSGLLSSGAANADVQASAVKGLLAIVRDRAALSRLAETPLRSMATGIVSVLALEVARATAGAAGVASGRDELLVDAMGVLSVLMGGAAAEADSTRSLGGVTARSITVWTAIRNMASTAAADRDGPRVLVSMLTARAEDHIRAAALRVACAAVALDAGAESLARAGVVDGVGSVLEGSSDSAVQMPALRCLSRVWEVLAGPEVTEEVRRSNSAAVASIVRATVQALRRAAGDMRVVARGAALLAKMSHSPEHWENIARHALPPLVDLLLSDANTAGAIETDAAKIIADVAHGGVYSTTVLELGGVLALLGMLGQEDDRASQAMALKALALLAQAPQCRSAILADASGDVCATAVLPRMLRCLEAEDGAPTVAGVPEPLGAARAGDAGAATESKASEETARLRTTSFSSTTSTSSAVAHPTPSPNEVGKTALDLLEALCVPRSTEASVAAGIKAVGALDGMTGSVLGAMWAKDARAKSQAYRVLMALSSSGDSVRTYLETHKHDVRLVVALLSRGTTREAGAPAAGAEENAMSLRACAALADMCRADASNREALLAMPAGLTAVCRALAHSPDGDATLRSVAAGCVLSMLDDSRMVEAVVREGAVPGIVHLLSGADDLRTRGDRRAEAWDYLGLSCLVALSSSDVSSVRGPAVWAVLGTSKRPTLLHLLSQLLEPSTTAPAGTAGAAGDRSAHVLAARVLSTFPFPHRASSSGTSGSATHSVIGRDAGLMPQELRALVRVTKACVQHAAAAGAAASGMDAASEAFVRQCLSLLSSTVGIYECGAVLVDAGGAGVVLSLLKSAAGTGASPSPHAEELPLVLSLLDAMSDFDPAATAQSLRAGGALPLLVALLRAAAGETVGARARAPLVLRRVLQVVHDVSKCGVSDRAALAEAGVVACLANVLDTDTATGKEAEEGESKHTEAAPAVTTPWPESHQACAVAGLATGILAKLCELEALRRGVASNGRCVRALVRAAGTAPPAGNTTARGARLAALCAMRSLAVVDIETEDDGTPAASAGAGTAEGAAAAASSDVLPPSDEAAEPGDGKTDEAEGKDAEGKANEADLMAEAALAGFAAAAAPADDTPPSDDAEAEPAPAAAVATPTPEPATAAVEVTTPGGCLRRQGAVEALVDLLVGSSVGTPKEAVAAAAGALRVLCVLPRTADSVAAALRAGSHGASARLAASTRADARESKTDDGASAAAAAVTGLIAGLAVHVCTHDALVAADVPTVLLRCLATEGSGDMARLHAISALTPLCRVPAVRTAIKAHFMAGAAPAGPEGGDSDTGGVEAVGRAVEGAENVAIRSGLFLLATLAGASPAYRDTTPADGLTARGIAAARAEAAAAARAAEEARRADEAAAAAATAARMAAAADAAAAASAAAAAAAAATPATTTTRASTYPSPGAGTATSATLAPAPAPRAPAPGTSAPPAYGTLAPAGPRRPSYDDMMAGSAAPGMSGTAAAAAAASGAPPAYGGGTTMPHSGPVPTPAPAPAPAPASAPVPWRCSMCTMENEPGLERCTMCNHLKPGGGSAGSATTSTGTPAVAAGTFASPGIGSGVAAGVPAPSPAIGGAYPPLHPSVASTGTYPSIPGMAGPSGTSAYPSLGHLGSPAPAPSMTRASSATMPAGAWECKECTFMNTKPEAPACEICGGTRAPADVAAAAAASAAAAATASATGASATASATGAPAAGPGPAGPGGAPAAPGTGPGGQLHIRCRQCAVVLGVPPGVSRFACGQCGTTNELRVTSCAACRTLLPHVPLGTPEFKCNRCGVTNKLSGGPAARK